MIKTKILFGRDRELDSAKEIVVNGGTNVLIVVGQQSVFKSGLLNRVIKEFEKENLTYHILQGVRANPTFELVEEGKKIVEENSCDFIFAIGGGSVIDTAKCIAVNAYYEGDIKDFNFHVKVPKKALPLGVILTLSASGSEMSTSCVIQDDETQMKMGFNSELVRPVFAIENPELTYSVNKEQTGYGVVDILMHTLERYFSESNEYELADEFALGLIKNVIDTGLLVYNNPDNYDYRARLMLAGSISHSGYTSIGKDYSMPVHQLEHAISGKFVKVAHACGLAVLFPGWAKEYLPYEKEKFARLGRHVFGIKEDNDEKCAELCVKAFEEYFKKMDLPSSLSEIGIKEKDIDSLVNNVSRNGSRVIPHRNHPMDHNVMRAIYLRVL